uniref:uncharacterized protein LOC118523101 isoform X4 n=1 Tax=Halichoerus grypus TaxID=9711 RepID=UPI001658EA71|nr:uncharacterized protein LOC118523101 isoform X4 [Halichoerus grypus]
MEQGSRKLQQRFKPSSSPPAGFLETVEKQRGKDLQGVRTALPSGSESMTMDGSLGWRGGGTCCSRRVGILLSWWIFTYCHKVQTKIPAGFLNRRKRLWLSNHSLFPQERDTPSLFRGFTED